MRNVFAPFVWTLFVALAACTSSGQPTTAREYGVALRQSLSSGTYYNPYFPLKSITPELYPDVTVVWRIVPQTGVVTLWTTEQTVRLGSQRGLSEAELDEFVTTSRRTMQEAVDRVPLMPALPGGKSAVIELPIRYRFEP